MGDRSEPLTWAELEQAAPEIVERGRDLIERFEFVLVGTLTKDGSPRITPVEAYIIDGHLLSNMIPRSLKARDLLRDPRVYVHAPLRRRRTRRSSSSPVGPRYSRTRSCGGSSMTSSGR